MDFRESAWYCSRYQKAKEARYEYQYQNRSPAISHIVRQAGTVHSPAYPAGGCPGRLVLLRTERQRPQCQKAHRTVRPRLYKSHWLCPFPRSPETGRHNIPQSEQAVPPAWRDHDTARLLPEQQPGISLSQSNICHSARFTRGSGLFLRHESGGRCEIRLRRLCPHGFRTERHGVLAHLVAERPGGAELPGIQVRIAGCGG